ncbi:Aerobic glycerol-3-phosphate dehydrogenase [hydrothermal vent metagenome]|uniref:Aerobic glycerol-3-phosphate dehydrogenase n=1 Tax=hydrothermal vent metagenome TaxID=652676 RepID=A0A3B0ZV77_9ZZZZ
MNTKRYDVTIIGAGIHGAGVAQAASVNGYKVLLLEKKEIAAGTSSRSSKLIHGGLRYLEHFELKLVFECLRERRILLSLAPELVKLIPVYIPVYKKSIRSRLAIRLGLTLYSILGGFSKNTFYKKISKSKWHELDGLEIKNLLAVYQFYDAQTDDSELTHAVINSAKKFGANVVVPAELLRVEANNSGYNITYMEEDAVIDCSSTVIINAAGPWINEVLDIIAPEQKKIEIDFIQGAHIILDHEMKKGIYYADSPADGRAIFFIPWKGKTLVGTTETVFTGDLEHVEPLDKEVDYLLCNYNHYFSRDNPQVRSDVVSKFAGLRVLMKSSDVAFKRSRDTYLLTNEVKNPSLITICGGKLTAYRHTAERVMKLLKRKLPVKVNGQLTENIKLSKPE